MQQHMVCFQVAQLYSHTAAVVQMPKYVYFSRLRCLPELAELYQSYQAQPLELNLRT